MDEPYWSTQAPAKRINLIKALPKTMTWNTKWWSARAELQTYYGLNWQNCIIDLCQDQVSEERLRI